MDRYLAVTDVYLASHSPSGLHSFSAGETALQVSGVTIRVTGIKPLIATRSLQNCEGFELEFQAFSSADAAYDFAAAYVSTLAARSVVHRQTSLSFSLVRVNAMREALRSLLFESQSPTLQLLPGINICPVLPRRIAWMRAGLTMENSRAEPAGKWIGELMRGTELTCGDAKLQLALAAFDTACGRPEPEVQLLNIFAALECLAGPAPAPEELVNRIDALQAKLQKDENYTDGERALLQLLNGKKSAGQRAGVEYMLRSVDSRPELIQWLNEAYKARNSYAHGASKRDIKKLDELVAAMQGVFLLFVHARLASSK